ncbi:hypothetical protein SAMN04488591_0919 [Microbacterium azadirachtae]|uniref:Uncharacterized protein n=1 Tax=Microbacterium azadirachtae TaxID=582680 RepID=A0A1I6G9M2_9MICO|nr:hypothetical protein SAMN04488593_0917 [Microbacterium azadirachtae]SEF69438.1 hypothetical protein SAMN04488594_0906 [Microbacterium azadirachtae]SEF70154.1 hypothetical protein SAMN04488592_0915 [Microbacterium azadirachtae]SFR38902.1 hypothetical protein SAMN04488591_0919 [Microbacterium azadirachtae]
MDNVLSFGDQRPDDAHLFSRMPVDRDAMQRPPQPDLSNTFNLSSKLQPSPLRLHPANRLNAEKCPRSQLFVAEGHGLGRIWIGRAAVLANGRQE